MLPRVRTTAAFVIIFVTSLLSLGQQAEAACELTQSRPGVVHAGGEKTNIVAVCDESVQTIEFLWKIVWTDRTGTHEKDLRGGVGKNELQNVTFRLPGRYEILLDYGDPSMPRSFQRARLPMTAAPAPPPVAAAKPPAPPPARVAFLDQVTFTPSSFRLKPGERATVSATKPNIGDPHIQWSIPGVKGTAIDKWTIAFTLRKPGKYTLDALVTDGSNSLNTKRWALPITVIGDTLSVRLRGHTKLQLNERSPVIVQATSGKPPYRITVSVAGGASASGTLNRQSRPGGPYDMTQFFVPTKTAGDKSVTIAVADAQGSTFRRTVVFSVAGAATPPVGANPFTGSYKARVTGPTPSNTNTYWAHAVAYDPDGTLHIALYALGDNYHVALKGGTLSMDSGNGAKASGTGSIAGNGAVGTTVTMQWTLTGSDGKPTRYTWVLIKYNDTDFGGPQPGFAR
jgi:hypothetical protein